jgi:hypothetical protein
MSEPFSVGQYWCCLKVMAEDGTLFIARLRLPDHPDASSGLDSTYRIECEVATMRYVHEVVQIPVPKIYAYQRPNSDWAQRVGASYMLMEGIFGNSLWDVNWDLHALSVVNQEKIIAQWTSIQVKLAANTFPQTGAIVKFSESEGPTIGKIMTDEAGDIGPFSNTVDCLAAIVKGKYETICSKPADTTNDRFHQLGPFVQMDIIRNSSVFKDYQHGPFPLNHMDMGTQNLPVDEGFNIVSVIDWEMVNTSPWEANYFPMPFPPDYSGDPDVLKDPNHIAYKAILKQTASQSLFLRGLESAEGRLKALGKPLHVSLAEIFASDASKVYWLMERQGSESPENDEVYMFAMARIAFGYDQETAEHYFQAKEKEMAG